MKRRHALLALTIIASSLPAACSKKEPEANPAAAASGSAPESTVKAQEAYEAASRANGFTVGQTMAANAVHVFFDPQCPHCTDLWAAAQPLLGKLKMVWMPVAFLHHSSAPQGALLLSASNPAATMSEHEALLSSRKGGLPVPAEVDAGLIAKVKANTELLQKLGVDSVPFIVYKNRKTGAYGSHAGSVSTEQLLQMVGA
jgi:thiol:disulfide interchange protein DsbG